MQLKVIERPEDFVVNLEDVKEHLRVTLNDEDVLIENYIKAATQYCEDYQNRYYLNTKVKLILDNLHFPIELPRPPLQTVEKVELQKADGTLVELDSNNYIVDDSGSFGWIRLANNYSFPSDLANSQVLQVTYMAGHNHSDDVPQKIKEAIYLMVGHWYENRVAVTTTGAVPQEINMTVEAILNQDRVVPV